VSAFALCIAASGAGCGDDGGTAASTTATTSGTGGGGGGGDQGGSGGAGGGGTADVTISFEGRVGDKVFDCAASYPGLGTAATEVKISDFRLYIHDVRLHKAGGGEVPLELEQDGLWQHETLALLDFENKSGSCANGTTETNTTLRGKAPAGTYEGVSFKLGVPFELNHGDASVAPSPLNLSAMFWSWNGGYKFLRVDSIPAGGDMAFNLHLGSTGCVGEDGDVMSCDRPNVAEIELAGIDPTKATILVDYAAVVAASDISQNAAGAPGCMSGVDDPECSAIFERLGINIADGSLDPKKQALFRVE
jgi:uncharacterized repeat protein (TIGR04052 family)